MSRQPINPAALPRIGQPFAGGFYAGRLFFDGQEHALVDSGREHERAAPWWDKDCPRPHIRGACSYQDGRANTQAMAQAGSAIAAQVLGLTIRGFNDWYLPALDELQVMRMNLCQLPKWDNWHGGPGSAGRGPEQAFCHGEYWTSTQRNAGSAYAMVMRPGATAHRTGHSRPKAFAPFARYRSSRTASSTSRRRMIQNWIMWQDQLPAMRWLRSSSDSSTRTRDASTGAPMS